MGSPRTLQSRPHNPAFTRAHQITAIALVAVTFILTRAYDRLSCSSSSLPLPLSPSPLFGRSGALRWPQRGFGPAISIRIYVYGEDEIDGLGLLMRGRDGRISADACVKGQWGTQVKIHQLLLKSKFRTLKKEEADFFFVPSYVKCVRMMGGLNDKEINQTYVKTFVVEGEYWRSPLAYCPYRHLWLRENIGGLPWRTALTGFMTYFCIGPQNLTRTEKADAISTASHHLCPNLTSHMSFIADTISMGKDLDRTSSPLLVLSQMPYFRLSGGRNHVFVFPSGAGAHLFRSWATFLNRSIILTPEGDRTDKRDISSFNTWKDIIIPGNVDDGMTTLYGSTVVSPIPLSKRKFLANFLGRAQGKVGRLQLVELSKQYPDKLEAPELKLTGPNKLGRTEYFDHLKNAKFCLAPRGESSWTLRFYESYFVECVPVILSDQVELPFQNVIDYTQISIKWPSTQIGAQLLEYLESIPNEVIEGMIARGRQFRCLWVYAADTEPCSATVGILWELQRKVRRFHQSAETFWLHNKSIINRDLVEFHQWRTPLPLP